MKTGFLFIVPTLLCGTMGRPRRINLDCRRTRVNRRFHLLPLCSPTEELHLACALRMHRT